ncbi:MAG: extracellular solute-binding protein [Anaerolineaceae bacterium]|nr:extracellular solute-binding protein [Anaerolineaceae bacterium]
MSKQYKIFMIFSMLVVVAMMAAACGPAAPATQEAPAAAPTKAEAPTAEQPAAEPTLPEVEKPTSVTLWTQLNTDTPASARDKIFAAMLPDIEKATGMKVQNINQPYDQLDAKLNLAVQAGGDVPDIFEVNTNTFGFHYANGNLQDITEYVKSAPWYDQLTPNALQNCTGPDGKIYCVPAMLRTNLIYYYPELFPNGYPKTTDELLADAPRLKKEGYFAITGKISEVFGAQFSLYPLVKSFGGSFADADGKIVWASPETVKVVEFFRELVAQGYAPESIAAAGFDNQTPFMTGKAGSFMAGSWSYAFLNPLETPGGQKFDDGAASIENALNAGVLEIAPPLAAPGKGSVSVSDARAWGIPLGVENIEAAKAYINFVMTAKPNADLAYMFGCVPTVAEALKDPRYAESKYWTGVRSVLEGSIPMDPITDNYDQIVLKFADTVVTLVLNPDADILAGLQKAQEEMNNLK